MKPLEGKVAVITGASRGLGLAIAEAYTAAGAKVVLSARSRDELEKNAASLNAGGADASAFVCDVSRSEDVEALARFAIQTYGQFDIWVNNAGVGGPYGPTLDIAPEDFLAVLRTNMFGAFYGSVTAMRHFLPRRSGKLINILGAGDKGPVANQNPYASTKAWIRVFTLAMAKEYKDSGVGVYAFQPGLMDTDLLKEVTTFTQFEQRLKNIMPFLIRAIGKPPEVPARKAVWLASSATDGKTGLYVRSGSGPAAMWGFLKEGLRRLFRLPVRPVEIHTKIIPSSFKPL
jgi:glucose 1-dehydrogenase